MATDYGKEKERNMPVIRKGEVFHNLQEDSISTPVTKSGVVTHNEQKYAIKWRGYP